MTNRNLTLQDKQLIDAHFQGQELARHYGPSGIYARVQRFIDDGLADARKNHDIECELHVGLRQCRCQDRAGYTFEDQGDGAFLVRPNPIVSGGSGVAETTQGEPT